MIWTAALEAGRGDLAVVTRGQCHPSPEGGGVDGVAVPAVTNRVWTGKQVAVGYVRRHGANRPPLPTAVLIGIQNALCHSVHVYRTPKSSM
eukprot:gene11112-biopygen12826